MYRWIVAGSRNQRALALFTALLVVIAATTETSLAAGGASVGISTSDATDGRATVNVLASVGWTSTKLVVHPGDRIAIRASGSWSCCGAGDDIGPNGYTQAWWDNFLNLTDIGTAGSTDTPHWGALIGYIGDAPPSFGSYTSANILPQARRVFLVGSSYDQVATLSGTLWLGFNDDAYSGNSSDNSGDVTATVDLHRGDSGVTVICPPTSRVWASSSASNAPPVYAFDCNPTFGSMWNSGGYSGTLYAQFTAPITFGGVVLTANATPPTNETYVVSGSADGVNWTRLSQSTQLVSASGSGAVVTLEPLVFAPVTYQYLRLQVNGGASWVGVNEVRLIVANGTNSP